MCVRVCERGEGETDLDVEDGAGTSGAQKGLQRRQVVCGRREGPPAVLDGNRAEVSMDI